MKREELEKKRENLQSLLDNPGWELFVRHAVAEYLGSGFRAAMKRVAADPVMAQATVIVSDEIEKLLKWPSEELRRLTSAEYEDPNVR